MTTIAHGPSDMKFGSGNYRDTGCEESPSCLSCHLPRCIYDVPQAERLKTRTKRRVSQMLALKRGGMSNKEVGEQLGISERSVLRRLQEYREASA